MRDEDEEVYRKHAEELTRFATFLVGPDHAPDVVSDAVLSAFSSRSWPAVGDRRAYLLRSVLNAARMLARSSARRREREQRAAGPEPERALGPDLDDGRDALALVARLSARQRAVVYLAYWEDLDPAASAGLLGISEGAVRRHLARGRSALRRMLDAD